MVDAWNFVIDTWTGWRCSTTWFLSYPRWFNLIKPPTSMTLGNRTFLFCVLRLYWARCRYKSWKMKQGTRVHGRPKPEFRKYDYMWQLGPFHDSNTCGRKSLRVIFKLSRIEKVIQGIRDYFHLFWITQFNDDGFDLKWVFNGL